MITSPKINSWFLSLSAWSVILLAGILPLHGSITVFLPEPFRYTKEILIVLLALSVGVLEFARPRRPLKTLEIIALGFLLWLGILTLFASDFHTALVASRYLGMGFLAFFLFSRVFPLWGKKEKIVQKSIVALLGSCTLSVLFGIWGKFLGGHLFLENFYSPTISSWVPGQVLPLYHQAGDFIRMQGMSSGPIEFSHLLLCGLFGLLFLKAPRSLKIIIGMILVFGITQSLSRSALLGVLILALLVFFRSFSLSKKQILTFLGGIILSVGIFSVAYPPLRGFLLERSGTSDHFQRPLDAFEKGLQAPLTGNLGSAGPAARIKNLQEKNSDHAFIAENVFADYFLQTGIIGLLGALLFWGVLFFQSSFWGKSWVGVSFLLAQMATIFDMVPLSLLFFLMYGVYIGKPDKLKKNSKKYF